MFEGEVQIASGKNEMIVPLIPSERYGPAPNSGDGTDEMVVSCGIDPGSRTLTSIGIVEEHATARGAGDVRPASKSRDGTDITVVSTGVKCIIPNVY